MSKDKIQNLDIDQYYINNAIGIATVHFSHIYQNDMKNFTFHHPLDYHIHFLTFYDQKQGFYGGVLLDTNDVVTQPLLSKNGDVHNLLNDLILKMSHFFIDKLSSTIKIDDLETCRSHLFERASTTLWDFFNKKKEETYLRDLKRFSSYVEKKEIAVATDQNIEDVPTDEYKGVEIWLSEERLLAS